MNIPELRLECLRLAIANYPQKSHLRQQEEAQHYLEWIMSPTVTIELPTPDNAPDINIDPEYNTHLQSFDTPERALRLNGWVEQRAGSSYNKEIIFGAVMPLSNGQWMYREKGSPAPIFWDKQKPFSRWLIEDVENKWDRTRCENYLKADGWSLNENFPFLPQFQKDGIATFWNGSQWGVRQNLEKVTAPHFWDGKDSFPAWLATEITKLQTPQEKEQEQEEPNPNPNLGPSPLISPEWRECETDGFMAMMLGDSYRICDMSSGCYPQHKENGMWTAVMDNGKFSHQSLITAQIACERHKARSQGSKVEQPEPSEKPQEKIEWQISEKTIGRIAFSWNGYEIEFDENKRLWAVWKATPARERFINEETLIEAQEWCLRHAVRVESFKQFTPGN